MAEVIGSIPWIFLSLASAMQWVLEISGGFPYCVSNMAAVAFW